MCEANTVPNPVEAIDLSMNPAVERDNWSGAFTAVQVTKRLCGMNEDELLAFGAQMIEAGFDNTGETLDLIDGSVDTLSGALAILKAGQARLLLGMHKACNA